VLAAVVIALVIGEQARAQSTGSVLEFINWPTMVGTAVIGQTLTATDALWRSPSPSATYSQWEWWRCARNDFNCTKIVSGPNVTSYQVTEADRGAYIRLARLICYPANDCSVPHSRLAVSNARGPVVAPAPTPTPTPPPPVATPTPTPAPVFVAPPPAPTPVPTTGQVLHETATRKIMRPFPTVRMRGVLTSRGARVTVFAVRAPRAAKVTVRCKGSCPRRSWSPRVRKKSLTRVRAFERPLRAGTVLSVSITRHGYVGKRTVFVIRRGQGPSRVDSCLAPGTTARRTKCPAG
jgi:hypothetical protein